MSPTRRLLLASALALAGCSRLSGDAGPQVRALVPTGGYVGTATDLRVLGTGFTLRGIQQISGGPQVSSTFTVVIGGRALTATPQAMLNGLQVLRITVPPDLPAGIYDVAVQDPYGAWGTLSRAFTMSVDPPPQLGAQIVASSTAELGSSSPATLTVQNTGGVAARVFQIQIDGAPVAASGAVAPGASVPFPISLPATVRGTQQHTVVALATDSVTGLPLSTPPVTAQVTVLAPPALTAVARPPPASVDVGQPFNLVVDVSNGGDVAARAVTAVPSGAGLVASAAAPAQDIAPGSTVTFTLPVTATQAGTLLATAALAGTDAFSNVAVAGSAAWPQVLVQTAPALSFFSWTLPASVDTGQAFTLKLAIANTGQAAAKGVAPAVPAPTGTSVPATCAGPTSPAAADLPGGAPATVFSWSCTAGASAGSLAFQTAASGTDANTGSAVSASGASPALAVQAPAALSASLTAPAAGNVGDTITLSFAVSDTGGASASAVTPAALGLAGTATGSVASGPTPASATLAGGGGSQVFTWTVKLATTGTLQITAKANGSDANTGAAVSATATASVSVSQAEATLLTPTDPFGGDGSNFASIFSYQGLVYLGPDYKSTSTSTTAAPANTQSGAVSMAPDGTSQKSVPWQLEVMVGARNGAYQPATPPPPLCHTIGFLNCKQNTAQCGPDNEGGRALFASGIIAGTEWYMVSGASAIGGVNYLYMTNPTFPLAAGGYDDLAYVQIQQGQFGSTRELTAAHAFGNALYLGFLDISANGAASQQNAPVLNVLNKMPSLPGYVAQAGSDIVNLNGVYLPAVGVKGSPANLGATSGQLLVDSIADFNGALYVANNGGIARSVGAIAPCLSTGCANWANATPADPAWAAQVSVTTTGSDFGGLLLSRRAVPWMVPFGGRVFAVRNTGSGPQIWACQPSAPVSPDTQPQCQRADWSLVAPNTAASGLNVQLSQMNDGNNTAATVLAASSSHLYVGFDNSKGGVQIYRIAAPLPATISIANFTGGAGCTAGTTGCQGIGGNGLSTPILTQFDDAHAFTYSGNEWIYVSANGTSGGPRIFRLAP